MNNPILVPTTHAQSFFHTARIIDTTIIILNIKEIERHRDLKDIHSASSQMTPNAIVKITTTKAIAYLSMFKPSQNSSIIYMDIKERNAIMNEETK
jgi:hypothetical protein